MPHQFAFTPPIQRIVTQTKGTEPTPQIILTFYFHQKQKHSKKKQNTHTFNTIKKRTIQKKKTPTTPNPPFSSFSSTSFFLRHHRNKNKKYKSPFQPATPGAPWVKSILGNKYPFGIELPSARQRWGRGWVGLVGWLEGFLDPVEDAFKISRRCEDHLFFFRKCVGWGEGWIQQTMFGLSMEIKRKKRHLLSWCF